MQYLVRLTHPELFKCTARLNSQGAIVCVCLLPSVGHTCWFAQFVCVTPFCLGLMQTNIYLVILNGQQGVTQTSPRNHDGVPYLTLDLMLEDVQYVPVRGQFSRQADRLAGWQADTLFHLKTGHPFVRERKRRRGGHRIPHSVCSR